MHHYCPKCGSNDLSHYPEDSGARYDYKTGTTTEYFNYGCRRCGEYFDFKIVHDPFLKKDFYSAEYGGGDFYLLGDESHDELLAKWEADSKCQKFFEDLVETLGSAEKAREAIKRMCGGD